MRVGREARDERLLVLRVRAGKGTGALVKKRSTFNAQRGEARRDGARHPLRMRRFSALTHAWTNRGCAHNPTGILEWWNGGVWDRRSRSMLPLFQYSTLPKQRVIYRWCWFV